MRLTNAIRTETRDTIINKLINPKIEKIKKQVTAIAQSNADNFYDIQTRNWMNNGPSGAFQKQSTVVLKFQNKEDSFFYHILLGNGGNWCRERTKFTIHEPIKLLAEDQRNEIFNIPKKSEKQLNNIIAMLDKIESERDELHGVLTSALWACSTRKQLHDNYPDLAEYLPKIEKQTKAIAVTNDSVVKLLKAVK